MDKYLRVLFLLQILFFAALSSARAQEWERVNSPYGSIRAVITTVHKTIIVGTGKGIILSIDKGNHWTSSNEGIGDKSIYCLAKTGDIIFAGTLHGVYRSLDDGKSWVKTPLPDSTYRVLMTSPQGRVFARMEEGDLYSTSDIGKHWAALHVGISIGDEKLLKNIATVVMDGNGNLIFPLDSCTLLMSADDGATWKKIIVGGIEPREWLRITAKGDNIIVGTWQHGLTRSSDDGATWKRLNPPKGNISIVDYTPAGNVFLDVHNPDGKYESSDNGTTWHPISSPFWIVSSDGYDGDTILAVARIDEGSALIRSVDGGISWNSLFSSFHDVTVIGVDPAGELYAGTEWCGAYKSGDEGATWEPIIDLSWIENIVFVNENCIALSTSISGVFVGDGKGKNWISAASHGLNDFRVHTLMSTKHGTLLAGGTSEIVMVPAKDGRGSNLTFKGGGLWRSADQGASWNKVIFDNSYSTTDNGATWAKYDSVWHQTTIETSQPDFSISSMGVDPEGRICMNANADYKTGLYTSTNEGESWNKLKDVDRYEDVPTSFTETTTGEIFSGISRSIDHGKIFNDIVNGLSSSKPNNLQPLSNGDMLASTGNGLFYLPHGGNTWYCVGFKNSDVKYTIVSGEYLFVSADFGFEDERNGMYRTNLRDIQALIPKNIVEKDVWREINQPLHKKLRLFSIDKFGTLWLADDGELAHSTDQGMHWVTGKFPNEFVQSLAIDTASQTLFLGSFDGLYQSKTQGDTWEQIKTTEQNDEQPGSYVHAVLLDSDGTIFLGVSQFGHFRSPCADTTKKVLSYISIGGSSYGKIYSRKPDTNAWIASESVLPDSPDRIVRDRKGVLYASVRGEGIYSSNDDGIAWQECNKGLLRKNGFYVCNIGADIDRTVNDMVMDAQGAVYAVRACSEIYRFNNDSVSWEHVGDLASMGSSLIIDSHHVFYIGTRTGVFRSTDDGKNWLPYSVGLTSSSIMKLMAHPNGYLFAATEDGRIYETIQRIEANQK